VLIENKLSLTIRQFTLAWQAFCEPIPGNQIASIPGVELIFSCLPVPFLNVAVLSGAIQSAEELKSLGSQACEWAAGTDVPWFLVVTHDLLSEGIDSNAVMESLGMLPALPLTGMIASDVAPAVRLPEGLEISGPHEEESGITLLTLNEAAYGMDMQSAYDALGSHVFWKDHVTAVGRVNGRPVSCSAVIMLDGYRYVAFVATHPDHQRRGYAGTVMRRVLEYAEQVHGKKPTFLHATEAGRPVYERMGYETASRHTLYIGQKFVQGH
jgi:GNAT superfamily N-acetyltransferase